MLGLANAERPRVVDVCYLANQNMFPSSTVLDSFPAVEYFLQWPQAVKVELRARLLNSVYIRLVTTPTVVFPFPNFSHVQLEAQTLSKPYHSNRTLPSPTWNAR
jgi:hypothetical protein